MDLGLAGCFWLCSYFLGQKRESFLQGRLVSSEPESTLPGASGSEPALCGAFGPGGQVNPAREEEEAEEGEERQVSAKELQLVAEMMRPLFLWLLISMF